MLINIESQNITVNNAITIENIEPSRSFSSRNSFAFNPNGHGNITILISE